MGKNVVQDHHIALAMPPSELKLSEAKLSFEIGDVDPADLSVPIVVRSTAPALYVTLTTEAQGRFADNSFLVPSAEEPVTVRFLPFDDASTETLKKTLRVE